MNVKELAHALLNIKPSLQDAEVKVRYENGEWHTPDIKFMLKEIGNLDKTGYSPPYPQYSCLNCIKNNNLAKQIENIKKSINNSQNNNQNDNR